VTAEDIEVGIESLDIEPGVYEGTLTGIEWERNVESQYHDGPVDLLRWTFAIDLPDGSAVELDTLSSQSKSPRSKVASILLALLGPEEALKGKHKRSQLVGRSCLVTVERSDDGFPKLTGYTGKPKKA
jgi:hypothetical protein